MTLLYTVVLALYFAALLGLGAWFNRRTKSREQYFLARGELGPAALGFSYSATQMSGSSYMGAVGTERVLGYNFAPAGVASAAAPWFTYVLLESASAESPRASAARRSWTSSKRATTAGPSQSSQRCSCWRRSCP